MTDTADGKTKVREDWVTILTKLPTLPLPPNSERLPFETERLIIRPPVAEDLPALHELRTQPEVMINTMRGLVDDDVEFTNDRLVPFLTPGDGKTFNFAICLKEAGDNKLIGFGGVHVFVSGFGWPEMGYMFRKEVWGKGYGTEFVKAFVQLYSALPRPSEPLPLRVTRSTLPADLKAKAGRGTPEKGEQYEDKAVLAASVTPDTVVVEEILTAIVPVYNKGSQGVIRKGGLQKFMQFIEPDNHHPPESGIEITLDVFKYYPQRKTQPPPELE